MARPVFEFRNTPYKGVVDTKCLRENTKCLRESEFVLCVQGGQGSGGCWLRGRKECEDTLCQIMCQFVPERQLK